MLIIVSNSNIDFIIHYTLLYLRKWKEFINSFLIYQTRRIYYKKVFQYYSSLSNSLQFLYMIFCIVIKNPFCFFTTSEEIFATLRMNYCFVSAKYCYAAHESRLHQNDRCKRFALCLVLTVRFRSLAPWGKLFQLFTSLRLHHCMV